MEHRPFEPGDPPQQLPIGRPIEVAGGAVGQCSHRERLGHPNLDAFGHRTQVSAEGAPSWEILPQAAGPGEVILSKRQPDLGLLSNFAATPFEFHGKRYASLEGFWQAMLYPEGSDDPRATFPGIDWKHTRDEVATMTAFEAKAVGDLA